MSNCLYSDKVYEFFLEEKLCDITLVAGSDGKKIGAHRLVLCAASEFFNGLMTSPLENERHEFTINDISGDILKSVVHFFYSGNIDINEVNAEPLLYAASFLLSSHLQKTCTNFITQSGIIVKQNCVGIWAIAGRYAFQELKEAAADVVFEHFLEVSKFDEFLRLDEPELMEILECDTIHVSSEKEVFTALVDWVQFDLAKRKALFPKLIARAVRVNLLNESFMMQQVVFVCEQFSCVNTIVDLCRQRNDPNNQKSERTGTFPDLLALNYNDEEIKIERFAQRSKQWSLLENIPINRGWFGAELIGTQLYIFGGLTGGLIQTVDCINLKTREMRNLQPMLYARAFPSILSMNESIYTIGGYTSGNCKFAERYDIIANSWTTLPSMSIGREHAAITKLVGCIFMMGGRDENRARLNSVEYYDPITNMWTSVAPMIKCRSEARAGVANGELFVLGGFDGTLSVAEIERYDHQANNWSLMHFQLDIPRNGFGLISYKNWFLIAGGANTKIHKSCDIINLVTGEKKKMDSMLSAKGFCHLFKITEPF